MQPHHAMAVAPQSMPAGAYNQPVVVEQRETAPGLGAKYNARSGRATGYVQLSCALFSIAMGIVQIVLESEVGIVGYGIWSSIFMFLPAAILGIASGNKNACVIISYMVMSILSCLMAFVVIIMAIVTAVVDSQTGNCNEGISSYIYLIYGECENKEGLLAVNIILAVTGLVEFITAIVAAAFCCGGVCCGSSDQANVRQVVHYYPNNVGPVVVGSNMGTPGVGIYGQPPMYPATQHQQPPSLAGQHGPFQSSPMGSPPPQYQPPAEFSDKAAESAWQGNV